MEIIPKSENSQQLFKKLVVSMAGFYSKTNRKNMRKNEYRTRMA